jgi:hypothetical protein
MIEYQLGKEYEFTVLSSPSKKQRRIARQAKRSCCILVKDADNQVLRLYHKTGLGVGTTVKCMVNGFYEDTHKPKLVLSMSEQPVSKRPRPIETVSSARLIYTPMGNKR